MDESNSNLSRLMTDSQLQEQKNEINRELAKIKGLLQNLNKKLPAGEEKKAVSQLLKKLRLKRYIFLKIDLTTDVVSSIYGDSCYVSTIILQSEKDKKYGDKIK